MKTICHFTASLGIAVLTLFLSVAPALGVQLSSGVWQEEGDAGKLADASAQDTSAASSPITGFDGTVGDVDGAGAVDIADVFKIIAAGSVISVTGDITGVLLYLFDASGFGIKSSLLTDVIASLTTDVTPGDPYFLAIAAPVFEPFDNQGTALFDLFTGDPTEAEALSYWSDGTTNDPRYFVTVEFPQTQVPEPATLLLLGTGLTGLATAGLRRRGRR